MTFVYVLLGIAALSTILHYFPITRKGRFRKKWDRGDYDWKYSKVDLIHYSLSDPNRKMVYPRWVRGDLKKDVYQIKNDKPKCNGYSEGPGWKPVSQNHEQISKMKKSLEENSVEDPILLL